MKKLATTIGLFTLMLLVTSFTTPNEVGGERSRPILHMENVKSQTTFEVGGERSRPILHMENVKSQTTFEVGGERSKPILY